MLSRNETYTLTSKCLSTMGAPTEFYNLFEKAKAGDVQTMRGFQNQFLQFAEKLLSAGHLDDAKLFGDLAAAWGELAK